MQRRIPALKAQTVRWQLMMLRRWLWEGGKGFIDSDGRRNFRPRRKCGMKGGERETVRDLAPRVARRENAGPMANHDAARRARRVEVKGQGFRRGRRMTRTPGAQGETCVTGLQEHGGCRHRPWWKVKAPASRARLFLKELCSPESVRDLSGEASKPLTN